MLRTTILRSAAAATRTAARPFPAVASRRLAIAPASRTTSFVPKVAAWQAVRCYASGSSLDKTEVYERIKQLLSGFDKEFSIEIPDKDADTIHSVDKAVEYILSQPDAN
ncbi:hypothetical protein CHGG_00048 [Chaetomium globosum CBS 148.51]|uniref:Acyl carrier protein n=1 Tax=Chaetomium globosum (strain ATCC 6205 / CBS 148.51 / DSM 1962 / NBRC 6347 / NRRL 1970) TaxID=306901 RepID=Q2HIA6_CHAGB|nr:uncharacterized protein CHGG_00048 [Chaetomium globosum CBS 148.51]EAQ91813.1 hypothetical protein CHGG_00048 [Chaetomium globosum CBS 148.51]